MTSSIHRITMAEYLSDPCAEPSLSSSIAHTLITKSPMHAAHDHPKLGAVASEIIAKRASKAADIGTVAHDLLLGGEGKLCVIDPRDYPAKTTGNIPTGWTNDAIRAAAAQARANGLTPLLPWDMAGAQAMATEAKRFIKENSEHPDIFDDGEPELTVITHADGVVLRCRPDWMSSRYLLHYKTTRASASPEPFIRGIFASMGYDMAMAFYELCTAGTNFCRAQHLMLVQEQEPPYACSLIGLSPALHSITMSKIERAVARWHECLTSNHWPGYDGRVHYAEPTPWALAAAEAMAMSTGDDDGK